MIEAIVTYIVHAAVIALFFAVPLVYIHWLDAAKKSGIVNHDYKRIENNEEDNNEEDNNDDRA